MSNQIYNVGGQIVTPDIYFQIGAGMIPGMTSFSQFGFNPTIRSDWETVWPTGGLYPWPTTATILSVVSDSIDDNAVGVGARQVEFIGLDINWDRLIETVELDGLTPVYTVGEFLRCNYVRVIEVGSNKHNIGTISVEHGVEGVLQTIEPIYNSSRSATLSVPNSFIVGITGIDSVSMYGTASVASILLIIRPFGKPYEILAEELIFNADHLTIQFKYPIELSEQTDFEVLSVSDSANKDSSVTAALGGMIVDKNYS